MTGEIINVSVSSFIPIQGQSSLTGDRRKERSEWQSNRVLLPGSPDELVSRFQRPALLALAAALPARVCVGSSRRCLSGNEPGHWGEFMSTLSTFNRKVSRVNEARRTWD